MGCEMKKAHAVWTGLEPATPCVTGRYSNQLNYQTSRPLFLRRDKCKTVFNNLQHLNKKK
jgi:hypothetical protein